MKQPLDNFDNPLTMDKLEEILSASQIKAQFFEFGYGIFNVYMTGYRKYGDFHDPYDSEERRYMDFMEAYEDMVYIQHRNGGKALLKRWFSLNRNYIGKRLFGSKYKRVKLLEKMLIDNVMLKDFVYNELTTEFFNYLKVSGEALNKGSVNIFTDKNKERVLWAYKQALESVYRLYIQKSIS